LRSSIRQQSTTWDSDWIQVATLTDVSEPTFSHLNADGNAHMVDVGAKNVTNRRAVARCRVLMNEQTAAAIRDGEMKKGDVIGVARVAGIQAAKRTSELIPLCHPLMISAVTVDFEIGSNSIEIEATVSTIDRTGVEMEALTACSVAALTIYDMCKSADKHMVISELALWEKEGGRSGTYRRPQA
jgi:cyclic pyranopterin phosphate synthase